MEPTWDWKKWFRLLNFPLIWFLGKRVNYEEKKEEWKQERKTKFHKSFFVYLTGIILNIKFQPKQSLTEACFEVFYNSFSTKAEIFIV